MAPKEDLLYKCKIRLLRDGEFLSTTFQKQVTGGWLLDYVCNELKIVEKYYFGLKYLHHSGQRRWVDLSKPLLKQLKDPSRQTLDFRVRYYPYQPSKLHEEITRYYLFMQLRRDLYHGRLVPSTSEIPYLCALIMQSELGDYEDHEFDDGFSHDIDLLPKLASSMEDKIIPAYKQLSGLTAAEAENSLIERVKTFETYGIDPLPVKEKNGEALHIGANFQGIAVLHSFRRIKLFKWNEVLKVSFDGKTVSIVTTIAENEQAESREDNSSLSCLKDELKKQITKYKCPDEASARFLWLSVEDQMAFFTLHNHDDAKLHRSGSLFRKKSYRFSGRCQEEVMDDSSHITRMPPDFVRASSASLNRSSSIRASRRMIRAPPTSLSQNHLSVTPYTGVPHSQSLPLDIHNGLHDSDIDLSSSHNVSDIPIEEERASSILPSPLPSPRPNTREIINIDMDDRAYVELQPDSGPDAADDTAAASDIAAGGDSLDKDHEMSDTEAPITTGEHVVDAGGDKPTQNGVKLSNDYQCQDQYVRTLQPLHIPPEILVTDDNDSEAEVETPTKEHGPVYHSKTNGTCKMTEEDSEVEEEFVIPFEVTGQQSAVQAAEDDDTDVLSDSSLREQLKINLKELGDTPRDDNSVKTQETRGKTDNHKQQSTNSVAKTVCKSLLVTTLVLCLLLVILLYSMYEAEWDNYYLAKLRYTDIMEAFASDIYYPLRAKVVSFMRNISS